MTLEEKAEEYCNKMMCTICSNIRCEYKGKCAEWETRKTYYLAGAKENEERLQQAKEIIKMVINSYNHEERFSFEKDLAKAEQFLKEIEK